MDVLTDLIRPAWSDIEEFTNDISIESMDEGTALLGPDGVLDSIGLVTFLSALEDRIQEKIGTHVSLASPEMLNQETNPLRNLATLKTFILASLPSSEG